MINPSLTKLVRSRWPDIGYVLLLPFFIDREEVKVQKKGEKKNEANIQSS